MDKYKVIILSSYLWDIIDLNKIVEFSIRHHCTPPSGIHSASDPVGSEDKATRA
jgi:hypothetical protein